MMSKSKRIFFIALALFACLFLVFVLYGPSILHFFSLETLKCYARDLLHFSRDHYYATVFLYLACGIGAILLFLPVVTLYMIAGGFLFGPWEGATYAIFGVTTGAIGAFMLIRATIGPWVEKYERKLTTINHFIHAYGFYALLFLRMTHLVPFFLLNIAAALMPISVRAFSIATFIGVIPGALLFAWTGQYLCSLESVWDLVSYKTGLIIAVVAGALCVCIAVGMLVLRTYKRNS